MHKINPFHLIVPYLASIGPLAIMMTLCLRLFDDYMHLAYTHECYANVFLRLKSFLSSLL